MLKERKSIDRCEILRSGHIQVREVIEFYDDSEPDIVKSTSYHRYVIEPDEKSPEDVNKFINTHRA